jgi:menaquinol-cytochrome c reductase iron-sulfur subunit
VQDETTVGTGGAGRPVTRRNFIVWYLGGLLGAMTAAALAPLLVFLWPSGSKVKPAQVPITLSKPLDQLQENETVQFNAPKNFGFRMADGGGDNYPGKVTFGAYAVKPGTSKPTVFSVTCSHLGCSVAFDTNSKQFNCPCHGSIFAIDGAVVHGPAAAPLSNISFKTGKSPDQIILDGYSLPGVG